MLDKLISIPITQDGAASHAESIGQAAMVHGNDLEDRLQSLNNI